NSESQIHLVGHNLTTQTATVKVGADGEVTLPLDTEAYRSRVSMRVAASALPELLEQEPNDGIAQAQPLPIPASVNGLLNAKDAADFDLFRFDAEKGEQVLIETRAAMLGSPADT